MKNRLKIAFALALSAVSLAACEQDAQQPRDPNAPVIVDEECPRADGEPCR